MNTELPWVILFIFLAWAGCRGELNSLDQVSALLKFKTGITHDPTGSISGSWIQGPTDPGGCPSSWYGIVCDNGNIAEVILENLNLSLTADRLCLFSPLSNLSKLSLPGNSISGPIPACVASLGPGLKYLDLSLNLLSSSLPRGIENLTGLTHLSLARNGLSGAIPGSISGLSAILSLDLSWNSFSGPLPSSLTLLADLVYLNLSANAFTGGIPAGFERIRDLRVLDIHGNKLKGLLYSNLFRLPSAAHVDLSSNSLTVLGPGGFPDLISESLTHLNLSRNGLEGSLLGRMGPQDLQNLKVLDLSFNRLSGELPGFYFAYQLEVLRLNNNNFSGSLPDSLLKGSPFILSELDLSSNRLSGNVRMISSFTLLTVNLSGNYFSGELPLVAGSCSVLDLSGNRFAGNLSRMVRWKSLEWLDLSRNGLTGPIPEADLVFFRLSFLNLSSNSLSGGLLFTPLHYPVLQVLSLSNNRFNDSFPTDIFALPLLRDLRAGGNRLGGRLLLPPDRLGRDPELRVLDLSLNRFHGGFPFTSGFLSGLYSLNISGNGFSGPIPESLARMTALVSMDVSRNRFSGNLPTRIPPQVGSLDLSWNGFYGTVPEPLRRFPESCFRPGNELLVFPAGTPPSLGGFSAATRGRAEAVLKAVAISGSAFVLVVLLLSAFFLRYLMVLRRGLGADRRATSRSGEKAAPGLASPDDGPGAWSPGSADSFASEGRVRFSGELLLLDEAIRVTAEELSRAPAEVLGRGGQGTSYRAVLDDGSVLTVKWLRGGGVKPAKDFVKAAEKLGGIQHPNVVGIRACYWGPARHEKLLLSDYVSPGSLAAFLSGGRGSLRWADRAKISADVARGLKHLHLDRSIVHGNLKATNVLLDGRDLTARVSDYGLHNLVNGHHGRVLESGGIEYQAPEQRAGAEGPSFGSDVYSLGVLLLEIVTGRRCGDVVFAGEVGAGVGLTEWVGAAAAEGRDLECLEGAIAEETADPATQRSMLLLLRIALRCVLPVEERPGIGMVYEELLGV